MVRRLFLVVLVAGSVIARADAEPRLSTKFKIPSRPAFCAGLMSTQFFHVPKPAQVQVATYTGFEEIDKFLSVERANRAFLQNAIDEYQRGRNFFTPQKFAKVAFFYQGMLSPLVWVLVVGITGNILRGDFNLSQIAGIFMIEAFFWAPGMLGIPFRFLRAISFQSGQLNRKVQNFVRTNAKTDSYETSFTIGSEVLDALRTGGHVEPQILSEQNFRDISAGLPRVLVNWYRKYRHRTNELFAVEARMFRGDNGVPVLKITTRQTVL